MKRKIKARIIIIAAVIFLVLSFITFVRAIFNIGDFQSLKITDVFYLTGKLAGLTGFLCLSLLIFSGDTARSFDRFFGLDKIIKFQRKFSLLTLFFILSHPLFFILSSRMILPYLVPDFRVLPLALGIISFYIFIIILIASKIYKLISYTIWQYIHLLTYLLFFFVFYHAFNRGSDFSNRSIRIIYFIIFIAIIGGIIYRASSKLRQKYSGKFYVQGIKFATKDTFTLTLKPAKPLIFKAGQFCFLRLNEDKLYARHPFTIASAPGQAELSFTAKLTGRFTKALAELKTGEEVIIDGPYGIFNIEDDNKDLVFMAGGVGITPFMSIIADRLKTDKTQNIILLYGSRTGQDIIYRRKLDNIKKNWFKKVYILSHEYALPETAEYEIGYVNQAIIKKYVSHINNSLFYICGPEPMKDSLQKILNQLGVKKRDVMVEDFFW